MKNLILWALVLVPALAFGQDTKQAEVSNADLFSAQAGALIEKQFLTIGTVKGIEVNVLKITNLMTNTTTTALRFQYEVKGQYTSDTKIAVLDSDELDGLIKSIKTLQTVVLPSTKEVYTEVAFKSRTGFEAGAFFSLEKGKWTAYLQLKKFDSKSMVFITPEDLGQILALVESARQKM